MKNSTAMRTWYAMMGAILWAGIYFTDFSNINWLIYLPAVFSVLAAITGFCPSQIFILKMLNFRTKKSS